MSDLVLKQASDFQLDEDRTFSATISSIMMDRDGEIVLPSAFRQDIDIYMKNPILLLFHGHKTAPVGKCLNIDILEDKVIGKFYIANTTTGNECLTLIKEGCLNGLSAGFVPINYEDNPHISKIPPEALKYSNGKRPKRLYSRCEMVEISLLPIPSNRNALIERAEKGSSIASFIVKTFDAKTDDDLELVIKEWIRENTQQFTLKSLWVEKAFWDESEHPRDNIGQFADKNKLEYKPTDQKLDEVILRQKKMQDSLDQINDKDSWSNFFKKWATRIGVAIGGYYLFKHRKKSEAYNEVSKRAKDKINEWLTNKVKETVSGATKGFEHEEEIDKILYLMDQIEVFLKKGKELGLEEEQEYKNIQKFYDKNFEILKRIVVTENKGLSSLWIVEKEYGLSSLIIKEMSKEEFKEEEHPRDAEGKFTEKYDKETSAIHHEKGAWGGTRKNAGRLPNDPVKLRENLRSRFKTEKQDISEDELKQKVIDYAVENKKPDLILLEKDPVEFQKKRDEELLVDAAKDRYRQINHKGSKYTAETSEDTANARDGVATSTNKWKQEVSRSESIIDALKTYIETGEVDKLDSQRSKLIVATAGVITATGLAAMLLKRPNILRAGGKVQESLKENSIRSLFSTGRIDPKELPNPTWLRTLNLVDPPKSGEASALAQSKRWTEVDRTQVGYLNKLLTKLITGKDKATVIGAKPFGLTGRWKLPDWHRIDRVKSGDNYKPRKFDAGDKYGLRIVDEVSQEGQPIINALNLAMETGKIKRFPPRKFKGVEFGLTVKNVKGRRIWHIENEKEFLDKYFGGKASVGDFPKVILRKTTKGEHEDFETVVEGYGTMAEHIEKAVPLISRKVLALLTVGTGLGTPGLFYFQKELEESTKGTSKTIEEQSKPSNEPSKADIEKPTASKKVDLDLVRAEKKLLDTKIKFEKEKQVTEALKKTNKKEEGFDPTQGLNEEDVPNSKKQESKGLYDIVMKAFYGENYDSTEEDDNIPIAPGTYNIAELLAPEIASMISDISQSCKSVIENGVPTHTKFEELNQIINEIYGYMKDQAKLAPEEEIEEENQISEKSFDKKESEDNKDSEDTICKVCGKHATEEQIAGCQEDSCPNNYLNMIVDKE